MAPATRSHPGGEDGMEGPKEDIECEKEKVSPQKKNVQDKKTDAQEKEVKLIAPYKRSDKIKEALLSRIKVLDDYFDLLGKVGEGTFSTVHLAALKRDPSRMFAVKHLVPTCHPTRIIRELQCLQTIGGQDNVIGVNVCLRSEDCVVFVMPYLPHQKFSSYVFKMDPAEVQLYMKHLLIALKRVHSFGIIHRDVKPSNFLYNRDTKQFLLIDFGLAQPVDELAPKNNVKTDKKRKRCDLNENAENAQKKKEELGELQAAKRPVLRPLYPNMPVLRPMVRKKVKDPAVSPPKTTDKEKIQLSTRFSASLSLSAKQPERTEAQVPRTSISSEVQPPESVNKSEPSCSTQRFQKLVPNPQSTCNNVSNFVVQDSQVLDKPGTSRTRNQTTGGVFPQPERRAPTSRRIRPCTCAGKSQICNGCMTRRAPNAARAGTPGFRPPEVLLKYPHQTTAVDIWSAGVILISILSGCSPFFRALDDITALAEIITVFGTDNVKTAAAKLGITVLCNENRKPYNLKSMCEKLRERKFEHSRLADDSWKQFPVCLGCNNHRHPEFGCSCARGELLGIKFPDEAYDLLKKLLEINPKERITAADALNHPFFSMEL